MFQNDLLRVFWTKAINTINYLLNMAYIRVLTLKTPYEMWYKHNPM